VPTELAVTRRQLEAAIDALPPDQRAVFLLREIGQLSYDEIAQAVDVEVGTVRSRLHRARAALQHKLANLLEHEDPRGLKVGR
jgi:RNA polymerase sigma-70 factor (ECF subfamily)